MTGYGRGIYKADGIELTVEIKTVNNRYLDINCKYPKSFAALEEFVRNAVKAKLVRGRTDVFINFTDNREKDKNISVDTALAKSLLSAAEEINKAAGGNLTPLTLSDVIRFPEVIRTGDAADDEVLKQPLLTALEDALCKLDTMRSEEGARLKSDMLCRLAAIEELLQEVKKIAPEVSKSFAEKLRQRVADYLKDIKVDEARLLNEVAVFSDRSNIDEELTRLSSHIAQFKKICNESNCGKKLDFLLQEFNREVNTVCSKSNDLGVTGIGLSLKNEIEKIREQVQNIE